MTGFRKALKKFEKLTKVSIMSNGILNLWLRADWQIHCMDLWTDEHLSKQAFSSGEMIDDLLKQMEELYTTHFGESRRLQGSSKDR